jgi:hypothetical protein
MNRLAALVALIAIVGLGCSTSDSDHADTSPDNEIVKAKCHGKAGVKDCSSQANRAKAISREAFAIKDILTSGRHDFARAKATASGDPMDLVKLSIKHRSEDDPDALKGYKFESSMSRYPQDEQVAGLFSSPAVAVDQAVAMFKDDPSQKDLKGHLETLKDLGVVFGTDGFEQNGCAAPTPYLLVIDTVGKTVDGIDLGPCEE